MPGKVIKRLLAGILILIIFFSIIMPIAPQFISLIDSFVDQNQEMFEFQVPMSKFVYNESSGEVEEVKEYVTIDVSILLKFAIRFLVYVVAPFGAFIMIVKGRW